MKRSCTALRLLSVACLSNLALTLPAHALTNGTLLIGVQVPDWAVGNYSCSGTLITPRVIVTAEHCTVGSADGGFYHRKTGRIYYGKNAVYPERYGPLGDVGITMMDVPFGGSADIQTAPVASYQEEKLALRDGNVWGSGTPLVIYAKNTNGNRTFSTEARTTDTYRDLVNPIVADTYKMFYRSVQRYRDLDADNKWALKGYWKAVFSFALADLMFGPEPKGFNFTDTDVNDAVILTPGPDNANVPADSPIYGGDSGGGIFFRLPDGGLRLVSAISGVHAHPRLSAYWPWVVKTLIDRGMRDDAIALSRKVLGTPYWGANDRKGQVGQIFVYDNPYNGKIEYFRLASLGSDGRYWYFPTNQQDNQFWEYLGTKLPDINQATTPLWEWGANDRQGTPGDIYIYNNPYSRQVEYFRMAQLGGSGLPINQTSSEHWEYLGTDLPTRPLKYTARLK